MSEQGQHVSDVPDWAAAMNPGEWYRISGDAPDLNLHPTPIGTRYLEDNDPANDPNLNPPLSLTERIRRRLGRKWIAPWSGRMGFPAITEAWNGAVFATRFGRSGSMIVFGGGHNDYFGSDVHAFDLASRQWRRLTTGFVDSSPDHYGEGAVYTDSVYPDDSPLPPHTYGYVQYDEAGNDFLLLKGQTQLGQDVRAVAIPHMFNLDTLSWRRGPSHESAILNSGGYSTWDARRRVLWGHSGDDGGGNAFVTFSPDGLNSDGTFGKWGTQYPNKLPGEANHNAMRIHPDEDSILVSVHARDSLASIDLRRPWEAVMPVDSVGAKPRIREYAALEFSIAIESFVYYSADDGPTVFAIGCDGPARWRKLNVSAELDPIADAVQQSSHSVNRRHTFGRFRVAHFDDGDLAILIRHVDSPVYAMKIPSQAR